MYVPLYGEGEGIGMLSLWTGVWNSNFWKDTLNMAFGLHETEQKQASVQNQFFEIFGFFIFKKKKLSHWLREVGCFL